MKHAKEAGLTTFPRGSENFVSNRHYTAGRALPIISDKKGFIMILYSGRDMEEVCGSNPRERRCGLVFCSGTYEIRIRPWSFVKVQHIVLSLMRFHRVRRKMNDERCLGSLMTKERRRWEVEVGRSMESG